MYYVSGLLIICSVRSHLSNLIYGTGNTSFISLSSGYFKVKCATCLFAVSYKVIANWLASELWKQQKLFLEFWSAFSETGFSIIISWAAVPEISLKQSPSLILFTRSCSFFCTWFIWRDMSETVNESLCSFISIPFKNDIIFARWANSAYCNIKKMCQERMLLMQKHLHLRV